MTPLEISPEHVRDLLRRRQEIALVDVREEALYAQGHPLWAANVPLSRLELEVWERIPRRDTLVVVYGDAVAPAQRAHEVLVELGYTQVRLLLGGLDGWTASGGELFIDVNTPSKAFGELVESVRGTPSVSAPELRALLDAGKDVVVVDARRPDEFHTMSIPTATSVPGGELVLRIRELAADPATQVVVNCAGRTRSIIGAQSLINSGLPNPVAALRNGTIGWVLAGQDLDHSATAAAPARVEPAHREVARAGARAAAELAGVRFAPAADLTGPPPPGRTVYRFDVRSAAEYEAGHLPGFRHAPGGQLVQETDHHAPVRGARIVLADDDGVRAAMTGSWLAQMGWETWVVAEVGAAGRTERGWPVSPAPAPPGVPSVAPGELAGWLGEPAEGTVVVDVGAGRDYAAGHIPGAWHASRSRLAVALRRLPPADRLVLTSGDGLLARFATADLGRLTAIPAYALAGGTAGWRASGRPVETEPACYTETPLDRYRRPYEGTDNARSAMEAYLEWEYGLVAQLDRDGTHNFRVS
ncbi:rhodanese homology domain-containing protein [Parafrankia discariae]|uniref:rhodanese homology domain-containing protein n=1 Tax=Parafrankia discariae TaxID=365528 RepID=UPI00037D25C8|nr:rhodanese homology domain-containing protein [Parafrankia discariae]